MAEQGADIQTKAAIFPSHTQSKKEGVGCILAGPFFPLENIYFDKGLNKN